MQKVNCLQDKWRNVVFFLVALLILAADQLSKTWIRANLHTGQALFDIGFLRIINLRNTGAAFGLFPNQSTVLSVVAFISIPALLLCVFLSHRWSPSLDNILGKLAFGLVLGGTIGNLTDRLRFGYVTDFIDFHIWPAFNVADAAITTGVIIVAYSLLRLVQAEKH